MIKFSKDSTIKSGYVYEYANFIRLIKLILYFNNLIIPLNQIYRINLRVRTHLIIFF